MIDLGLQPLRFRRQAVGRIEKAAGRRACFVGSMGDAVDVIADFPRAIGRLKYVAGDFARRRALLIDCSCDLAGYFVDLRDGPNNGLDSADGVAGGILDALDLRGNLLRRLGGLVGQSLDLARDDGKSPAVFAGACRLDGGVQGQEVGLAGDVLNERYDFADLLG